jgi:hypothetical protein
MAQAQDRQGARKGSRSWVAVIALLTALAAPAAAQAARAPAVTTGHARQVSYGSALLAGEVNPNGADTSYYFQYGLTKAYGGQSTIADAGAGTRPVAVSTLVTGLQPLSVYHFRLVAVNGAGAIIGGDHTFLTTKVPLSLQIFGSPNPVLYLGDVTIQGTLSGTNNANRAVVLQADQFPFTTGFQNASEPHLTTATGGFSFPILRLAAAAQYRVVTTPNPAVVSPVVFENVAVRVSTHVARTRRSHFARFYGTVTPAVDGMQVAILRIVHGSGVLVGGTNLRHLNATSSKFSRVVPVSRGVYRVLVRVTNGAQVSNYGQPLVIG